MMAMIFIVNGMVPFLASFMRHFKFYREIFFDSAPLFFFLLCFISIHVFLPSHLDEFSWLVHECFMKTNFWVDSTVFPFFPFFLTLIFEMIKI